MILGAKSSGRIPRWSASRRWASLATCVVLTVGIAGSVGCAIAWRSYESGQSQRQFGDTATTVAQAVSIAFQRDSDLSATARVMVQITPDVTNARFSSWFTHLDSGDTYPGSFGLMYIEAVPDAQLGAFEAESAADPPFGIAPSGAFEVVPAGATGPYCLTRFGSVQLGQSHLTMGQLLPLLSLAASDFDYCAMPIGKLLRASAASGTPAATTLASLVKSTPQVSSSATTAARLAAQFAKAGLVATLTPVYSHAATTDAGRQAALQGWVLGVVQASSILDPLVREHPGLSAVLSYRGPNGGDRVLDQVGTGAGSLTQTVPFSAFPGWSLTLTSPPPISEVSATWQASIILLCGLAVSLLLFFLVRLLARSRANALALVKERTAQLRHQALHDSLTDLPNRALIFDRVEQMLGRARRDLTEIAILFIDLDQFKDVNDTLGHAAGDDLLRLVGARFRSVVHEADTVGRLGGDEFVVLVEEAVGASRPVDVAERLLLSLLEPFTLGRGAVTFQPASIGIASDLRESAEEPVGDADIALHEAKATAPGGYVVFHPDIRAAVTIRLELEAELRTALAKRQFFLVYQPIFDLRHEVVVGVEALIRWQHPDRGVVMPADFVPTLESTLMILDVGRFVLLTACRQAAAWHPPGESPTAGIYISVNVSARQLERADFVDTVAHALSTSGLAPNLLTLEITETTLMRHSELSARRLTALKGLGVKLAIDDFGTGYCSLSYLRQFPVDALKIDQSFVASMEDSSEGARLVHTIVQLGRDLGLDTVAEGIETTSQLHQLQLEECVAGQGYLLGRPLEVPAMSSLLRDLTGLTSAHLEPA